MGINRHRGCVTADLQPAEDATGPLFLLLSLCFLTVVTFVLQRKNKEDNTPAAPTEHQHHLRVRPPPPVNTQMSVCSHYSDAESLYSPLMFRFDYSNLLDQNKYPFWPILIALPNISTIQSATVSDVGHVTTQRFVIRLETMFELSLDRLAALNRKTELTSIYLLIINYYKITHSRKWVK